MQHPIPTMHSENSDGEAEQRSAGSEPKFEKSKLRAFITQGGGKVLQVITSAGTIKISRKGHQRS